jgi:hypothetical protein
LELNREGAEGSKELEQIDRLSNKLMNWKVQTSSRLVWPADFSLDHLVGEADDVDDHLGEGAERRSHHHPEPASELG